MRERYRNYLISVLIAGGTNKMDKKLLIILVILVPILIQGTYGIELSFSGGDAGESGSVSTTIDAANEASVNEEITIDGATVTPSISMSGPISLFEQTHGVSDTTGKSASVYVKVVNALDGLTYSSRVLPGEGTVSAQPWVSAEQWLTVPKADYIKCTAKASYGALSADVGIEEIKGPITEDYVTLTGYYGKAYASDTLVYTGQIATDGSANSFKIDGQSNDGNVSRSIDTEISGTSGKKAIIQWLNSLSSAGNITQATQKAHIHGEFTSTAVAGSENITRTSNYGDEYDLSMKAINGTSPTGTVGYYVNPNMTTSSSGAIQGAVNASQSGDAINLYPGTYNESVRIDKSLAVKGSGANNTIVDGNRSGSVFVIGQNNTNASVELSAMTIQGGSGTLLPTESNGTQNNYLWSYRNYLGSGTLFPLTSNASLYGGGILNYGNLEVIDINVSENSAHYGGGIANFGNVNVNESNISGNTAYYGGGIYNRGTANITGSNLSTNSCQHVITEKYSLYGAAWWPYLGSGGGIFNDVGSILMIGNSTISGNIVLGDGGGIDNLGTATVTNSTITQNAAWGENVKNPREDPYFFGSQGGTPLYILIDGRGGGIMNSGTITLIGSNVSGNSADRGGGIHNIGTAMIGDSIVSNNFATSYGGGIVNYGSVNFSTGTFTLGTLNVINTIISGNEAYLRGGGIDNGGRLFISGTSQITHNQATTGISGGIYSSSNDNVTLNGTEVSVEYNKGCLPSPSPSELNWYQGSGIYSATGIPVTTGGFNPEMQVTNNTLT